MVIILQKYIKGKRGDFMITVIGGVIYVDGYAVGHIEDDEM